MEDIAIGKTRLLQKIQLRKLIKTQMSKQISVKTVIAARLQTTEKKICVVHPNMKIVAKIRKELPKFLKN